MSNEKILEIQTKMKQADYDMLLLFSPEELVMAIDYFPFWGKSICLIPTSGSPLLIVPTNEPPFKQKMNYTVITYNTESELILLIQQEFEKMTKEKISLGASLLPKNTSVTASGAEQGNLSQSFWLQLKENAFLNLIDCTSLIVECLKTKSITAINKMRTAHEIVEQGIDVFYSLLDTPITESELKLKIEHAINLQVLAFDVTYINSWAQIQSGKNSLVSGIYNTTSTKQLNKGELVMLELAVCVDGYWVDLSRTGVVGIATTTQLRHYQSLKKAQNVIYSHIKPGMTFKELYNLSKEVLKKQHLDHLFPHPLGHGVGYQYHEPFEGIHSNSSTLVEEGMILTIEPGIYGEEIGGGMRVEENILVTSTGCQLLSYPRELNGGMTIERI
ncbi:M24 family metallopeptidase [Vagococcus fluvialis]|uniref:M24 family metallopeptidase n=1 Tax=Vagococcus fluvialis TaxID=2738 RepID=UPI003B5B366B